MARRKNSRHPTRRPVESTVATRSAPAWRWMKGTVAFVVTLGAVAGAITAVKALWPAPDPQDRAQLTIQITPRVPLSDYTRLLDTGGPQGWRRVQPTEDTFPTEELPTEEPTDIPTVDPPTCESDVCVEDESSTTGPDPDTDVTVSDSDRSSTTKEGFDLPPGMSQDDLDQTIDDVVELIPGCVAQEAASCASGLQGITAANSVDESGNKVSPTQAAELVLEVLREARTTERHEPLGVLVDVGVELTGLADTPVEVTWLMSHAETGTGGMPDDWVKYRVAYQLIAGTENDTRSVPLWLPLPPAAGPYVVRVAVQHAGRDLVAATSEPFD
jgi:hypothetical protein